MAVVLDIKRRIDLSEEPPRPLPARRLPPVAGPAVFYWLCVALVTWGIVSGRVPLAEALEGARQGRPSAGVPTPARRMASVKPPSRPMRQRNTSVALTPPPAEPPEPEAGRASEGPHLALSDPLAAARFDSPVWSGPTTTSDDDPSMESEVSMLEAGRFDPRGDRTRAPTRSPLLDPGPRENEEKAVQRASRALTAKVVDDPGSAARRPRAPPSDRPAPSPRARARPAPRTSSLGPGLPSCEAARARASQNVDMTRSGKRPADLPRQVFSRVLDDGSYLGGCGVPETMTVDICVAVQSGRVVGVTVSTEPASDRVGRCVAASVARLGFPSSPHLDVATTRFEALR